MPDKIADKASAAGGNALRRLAACGQSCWLDDLSRRMMADGEFSRLIAAGVRGVTANPATVAKAMTSGTDYDTDIRRAAAAGRAAPEIYEALVTADIRRACDILRPVYDDSDGGDGFVSLEVSPHLANDTGGSIAEAKRLWAAVDRPNLFIKIPGTRAGVPAIEELLFDGVNINITLLFSVERYEAVAEAFLSALRRRIAANRPVAGISSVASFFLSRIDVLIDKVLADKTGADAHSLRGKVAIANARLAYQSMKQIFGMAEWEAFKARGARAQRLLWASTGTKNPLYPDLMYVEPLIGPMTVNTMPEQTIAALIDHGSVVAGTIEQEVAEARDLIAELERSDIRLADIAARLEREGIAKFEEALDQSITHIEDIYEALMADNPDLRVRRPARPKAGKE
ncbi:MAG: transaldolase [Stellaceae bacterium]